MNAIKLCIFSLFTVVLFSCGEDYENFDNKAYINSDTKQTSFLIKPDAATYSTSLNVAIPRPAAQEMEFTFKADASLVTLYNSLFQEKAIPLPAEHYNLSGSKVTIAQESVRSTDIGIEFTNINQLDREKVYVLPVTITGSEQIALVENARTHYYIFKGGAIINWAADIEQNNIPITWGNEALVSNMQELTIESMLYLREVSRDGSDLDIMTFFGVEGGFLIRLGDVFEPGQVQVCKVPSNYPDKATDRTKVPVGKWFHLAITMDASNVIRIYLDGEFKSASYAQAGTVDFSKNCYIGKSWNDNRWWAGMICETRLWNVARTQEEIASSIYSVNPASEGLVAYWKFDEGNGNTIIDQTGNNSSITAASTLKWTSVSLPE